MGYVECLWEGGVGRSGRHFFFSHQHILQRAFPVFLRKPIAICDFPCGGGDGPPEPPPLWIPPWDTRYMFETNQQKTIPV